MNNMEMVNEMMAVLGFAIPSAVLWQVWTIKQSYQQTQRQVEALCADLTKLKRMYEDELMIKRMVP